MTNEILIRVHRDEQDVGYFTPETALECLRCGILRPDDWAYCEGLSDWTPLEQLLDVPAVSVTPPPIPALRPSQSPPPLPARRAARSLPPVISIPLRPAGQRSTRVEFALAGGVVCFLGLLLVAAFFNPSQPESSSGYSTTPMPGSDAGNNRNQTSGLLPPLTNFDVNDEPVEAVPELGMSAADVANFREWLAAGAPRYWKGRDQFSGMSNEQWEQLRQSTREKMESGKR